MNREIRAHSVRIISETGEQLGIMHPQEAVSIARERGLDLVEVAPEARPPVCKIMDYGKLRYDQTKRSAPKPKFEIKTITLRPKTGEHDLQTKLSHARKFLEKGNKVRFQVRMRGRERAKPGMWADQLNVILARLSDIAVVTQKPAVDGRGIFAMVEPTKAPQRPRTGPEDGPDQAGDPASSRPSGPPQGRPPGPPQGRPPGPPQGRPPGQGQSRPPSQGQGRPPGQDQSRPPSQGRGRPPGQDQSRPPSQTQGQPSKPPAPQTPPPAKE